MKDPCTIALELDQELMAIHENWMNDESIEEFLNDKEMNIQCDEFAQENYTVWEKCTKPLLKKTCTFWLRLLMD